MRRLTDEEIRKMPLNEAEAYVESHPDEAGHFAKVFSTSALKQTKKAVCHLCGGAKKSRKCNE